MVHIYYCTMWYFNILWSIHHQANSVLSWFPFYYLAILKSVFFCSGPLLEMKIFQYLRCYFLLILYLLSIVLWDFHLFYLAHKLHDYFFIEVYNTATTIVCLYKMYSFQMHIKFCLKPKLMIFIANLWMIPYENVKSMI